MPAKIIFIFAALLSLSTISSARNNQIEPPRSPAPVQNISNDLAKITKSVQNLNKKSLRQKLFPEITRELSDL